LTAKDEIELKTKMCQLLDYMISWFTANVLSLNTDKTNIIKFTPSNKRYGNFQLLYQTKQLIGSDKTKFLGLELDNRLNWKKHIKNFLPKLGVACYVVRRLYPLCEISALKMVYFAYFH
jgi:hypothetical protein